MPKCEGTECDVKAGLVEFTALDTECLVFEQKRVAAACAVGCQQKFFGAQSNQFPLAAFAKANTAFDPAGLIKLRFVFNRTSSGVVVLDDIGFRQADR